MLASETIAQIEIELESACPYLANVDILRQDFELWGLIDYFLPRVVRSEWKINYLLLVLEAGYA